MPQKFFMVWRHDTPTTEKRHPTYVLAYREADRIARKHPGYKVYVLEATDYRWVQEKPLAHVLF
ncbi:hypothetical protein LCGC14_3130570 [marine sediment metagenome]|uniref:Uncharacterized protein n=1 Tax=marine sediment metagenome TaxID=412755 RepID=A0A0F8VZS6_9ZZZZ